MFEFETIPQESQIENLFLKPRRFFRVLIAAGGFMKGLILSVLVLASFIADNASAQSSARGSVESFKSYEMTLAKTSEDTNLLSAKFGSFQSGSVQFNRSMIRLLVYPKSQGCPVNANCIMMVPAPIEVKLQVKAVVMKGCSNIYYAQTADNVKSLYFEEVRLIDPNTGRCTYIQEEKGDLAYRISGFSSGATTDSLDQKAQANWAQFILGSSSEILSSK